MSSSEATIERSSCRDASGARDRHPPLGAQTGRSHAGGVHRPSLTPSLGAASAAHLGVPDGQGDGQPLTNGSRFAFWVAGAPL